MIDVANDRVVVRLGGTSGCSACDAGKGCGAGIFGRVFTKKPVSLELKNTVKAGPGQPVMVGIPEVLYLRLILNLYFFPLLAGIGGALLGHYLSVRFGGGPVASDLSALAFGVALAVVTLGFCRRISREFPESTIVELLRVVEPHDSKN